MRHDGDWPATALDQIAPFQGSGRNVRLQQNRPLKALPLSIAGDCNSHPGAVLVISDVENRLEMVPEEEMAAPPRAAIESTHPTLRKQFNGS